MYSGQVVVRTQKRGLIEEKPPPNLPFLDRPFLDRSEHEGGDVLPGLLGEGRAATGQTGDLACDP